MTLLHLPYLANVAILLPVCAAMSRPGGEVAVFEGRVAGSDGLRAMVAALWAAILVASLAGLLAPVTMVPILAAQVVYKALWLAVWVAPRWAREGPRAVPVGITSVFAGIVLVWPVFIWMALGGAGPGSGGGGP